MNFKIFFYCIIFILPEVDLFIFSVQNLFDIQIYDRTTKKEKGMFWNIDGSSCIKYHRKRILLTRLTRELKRGCLSWKCEIKTNTFD